MILSLARCSGSCHQCQKTPSLTPYQLLVKLRRQTQPPYRSWTGIKYIDDIADAYSQSHISRHHLHSTSAQRPASTNDSAPPPPVIEISSISQAAGKTELLYQITANLLLGTADPLAEPGTVVFIDLASRFSAARLFAVLKAHLDKRPFTDCATAYPEASKAAKVEAEATAALDHLHVFAPQTSDAFLTALRSVKGSLLNTDSHHSAQRRLLGILIADVSAFYWQDRHEGELASVRRMDMASGPEASSGASTVARPAPKKIDNATLRQQASGALNQRWRAIVAEVRILRSTFECAVICTNVAVSRTQRIREGLVAPSHLPGAWIELVNVRLLLDRQKIKYDETMSAEEALSKQAWRLRESHCALSKVSVNMWRYDEWERSLREAIDTITARLGCTIILDTETRISHQER